jgi:hypothetical protein
MIKALIRSQIGQFGSRYDYDVGYLQNLADDDIMAAIKIGFANSFFTHDFGLPSDVAHAARLIGTRFADCGPCLKLGIAMAQEDGIPLETVRAILLERHHALPQEVALAVRHATAVVEQSADLAETVTECEARWRRRGVMGLSVAIVAGQFYPMIKRGLGLAHSCEPVLLWLDSQAKTDKAEVETGAREAS